MRMRTGTELFLHVMDAVVRHKGKQLCVQSQEQHMPSRPDRP